MAYNIILTPEQEQRRKDSKQALESLKYNPICYNCKKFCCECNGTTCKVCDGCVYKEKGESPSVYALVAYVPELIKNEDFSSYDEFLKELRNNRAGVIDWLESRTRGEHFKNEVFTEKYIAACKKILNILKEA
jgi:hypothetical protein